jgi:hypothetical protein
VSSAAHTSLRIVEPDHRERMVLRGRPQNLRGELRIANDGDRPEIAPVPLASSTSDVGGGAISFTPTAGAIVQAGVERRMPLRARVAPHTPPGTYEVEVTIGGTTLAAQVEVVEEIELSFSPTSVVVDGVSGAAGSASVMVTNRGNVPLPISRLGPTPLDLDGARSTLLDRLLGRAVVAPAHTSVIVDLDIDTHGKGGKGGGGDGDDDEGDTNRERDGIDDEDEALTISGVLETPISLAPGETRLLEWSFEIQGEPEPGRRYRALAACYTTDLEIIVVPHQDGPASPAQPTSASSSASSASGKRRPTQQKRSSSTKKSGASRATAAPRRSPKTSEDTTS